MKQMLPAQRPNSLADRLGVFLATACIVHCTALPLAVTMIPMVAQATPESHWLDGTLVALATPLCIFAMLQGWRLHGSRLPSAFAAPGVVILISSVAIGETYGIEEILTFAGAGLIGVAHLLNLRGSLHCERRCSDEPQR